jgi:DnaK suppressor protein
MPTYRLRRRRTFPTRICTALLEAADKRHQQLTEFPLSEINVVATARRDSVERILSQVHAAVDRLDAGTYGDCDQCGEEILVEQLLKIPWATHCARCAQR